MPVGQKSALHKQTYTLAGADFACLINSKKESGSVQWNIGAHRRNFTTKKNTNMLKSRFEAEKQFWIYRENSRVDLLDLGE